jgi:hypothetical protein
LREYFAHLKRTRVIEDEFDDMLGYVYQVHYGGYPPNPAREAEFSHRARRFAVRRG